MNPFYNSLILLLLNSSSAYGYWLMAATNFMTTQRVDPIVSPGKVSSHVHSVVGGSNFGLNTSTESLQKSKCTSVPILQDKSNYWFPHLYFQWSNGSVTSLTGGAVICSCLSYLESRISSKAPDYLFDNDTSTTVAFPDNFRMISGDPTLRNYNASSFGQQAVTFLCLNFDGTSTRHNEIPTTPCPSGIRSQINFPSCWDGKNIDSKDHKSHVDFLSDGPDQGTCSNPKYPVPIVRIFMEVYWTSYVYDSYRSHALNATQPFVFSYGDPTGYGYHADFINGWDNDVLQGAINVCRCNPFGDPTCCAKAGVFNLTQGTQCHITPSVNENVTGTLPVLPGNNPVQRQSPAKIYPDAATPAILAPVHAYTGSIAPALGAIVKAAVTAAPSPT